ncbi:exporter of the RND superfamily protein-like protein [Haloterrigena turkmenica DSM 5511]|uniref:Exporter of the RND superfamily protein-like protein n=1 Tax=Haloterrigena turkmenica (strain ATCC 51198 / DSM 5511 / JCM 9101 / NCIMB 13204 / VKM B-1734 / 4k) TaxID=543526 RepID=D2RPN4_HALTV|nr:MMPL family transporter [Haloterrigena turkmenica]ADB62186.1 exporter of the RND superfamily protein-like protein [Haloterrigena turkmenica DSM 5511]
MSGSVATKYAEWIVSHSRLVIVLVLSLTAVVAAGAAIGESEEGEIGQFDVDSEETDALEEIESTYGTDDAIVAQVVVRDEGGDVLTRESLLEGLELQRAVREDEELNATLDEQGFVGLENVVGTAAVYEDRAAEADGPPDASQPTLEEQIAALESRSDEEVEELLADVLDPDGDVGQGGQSAGAGAEADPYEFLPTDYEPGETEADARLTLVFQVDDSGSEGDPEAAYAAQVDIADRVDERFDDAFVFGQGISDEASSNAVGDSFAIITPVALVFVLCVLAVTYRDVVDVLLGLFGIGVVLVWLAGIRGWLEIPSSQLLIAVPFLLIGLSIDYALHVVMRYREARAGELEAAPAADGGRVGADEGMRLGLAGVALALAAATVSTGVGFLSNVVSPLPAIRDFAVLSAGGILAAFVAFAVLVPALKVEVDGFLERRFGRTRAKPAFGSGSGIGNRVLSGVAAVPQRLPLGIVLVAFLLATGGAYGATTIDTEFNQADFLPEDAPEWAKSLPGPLAPDTYTISDDAAYLGENFGGQGENGQTQVLIRGAVTDPDALVAMDDAVGGVDGDEGTIASRPGGDPAIEGPPSVIRDVASENETVAAALEERDTTGDRLPNEDVAGFYDVLFDADSDRASAVLYRADGGDGDGSGDYESARLVVDVQGDASAQAAADDTRDVASAIEDDTDAVTATAAGGPVTTAVVQDALLETLVEAFVVTLVVIFAFLTALYWVRHRALSLGAITLAPVVAALAWLLGAMALLGLPFNSETAVITSLAIGLGVDYSIHVGERFVAERSERDSLPDALAATITGTGGALLGSAATTAAGFGVLALALAPPLQRFGLVTGLSIVFAFVACLTVLPCLLVLRERLLARLS